MQIIVDTLTGLSHWILEECHEDPAMRLPQLRAPPGGRGYRDNLAHLTIQEKGKEAFEKKNPQQRLAKLYEISTKIRECGTSVEKDVRESDRANLEKVTERTGCGARACSKIKKVGMTFTVEYHSGGQESAGLVTGRFSAEQVALMFHL